MIWYHFWLKKRYFILGVLTGSALLSLVAWRELWGFSAPDIPLLRSLSASAALLVAALGPWGVMGPLPQLSAQYTFSLPVSRFHWVVTRTLIVWAVVAAANATTVAVQTGWVVAAGHGELWTTIAWNGWLHTVAVLPVLSWRTIGQFVPAVVGTLALPIFLVLGNVGKVSQWLSEASPWMVAVWALALSGIFLAVAQWGARRREF